jgi:hypothetical protein
MESLTRDEALHAARFLSGVVGKAHGRQLNATTRKSWAAELKRNRPKSWMRLYGSGQVLSILLRSMRKPIWIIAGYMRSGPAESAKGLRHFRDYTPRNQPCSQASNS